jgi:hypothetical protein
VIKIQDPARQAWYQKWSADMASNAGSRVPGPEQAVGTGIGGPKPGFRSFPKSKGGGRVPPYSQAQVRKGGPPK